MRTLELMAALASLNLAGCTLIFSASEHQQGVHQQGSPATLHHDDAGDASAQGPLSMQDGGQPVGDGDGNDAGHAHGDGDGDMAGDGDHAGDGDTTPEHDAGHGDGDIDHDAGHGTGEHDAGQGGDGDSTMCGAASGGWQGCRGDGCSVCSDLLLNYPLYLQNHPDCVENTSCGGLHFACNARCPAPGPSDRKPVDACDGTGEGWLGCRGSGCWVCAELLKDFPHYTQNHPACGINDTCQGQFFSCNASCPEPGDADR
jgi:hypothetical protein